MKNSLCFLVILIAGISLTGCKSTLEVREIPQVPCEGNISVKEFSYGNFLSPLGDLEDLSYAYTYTILMVPLDTLEREKIRNNNALLAGSVIAKNFPGIEILPDTSLSNMTYNDVLLELSRLEKTRTAKADNRDIIGKFLVPSRSKKQLFIKVTSYYSDKLFRNYINVYVFDTLDKALIYYNPIGYSCDIRDRIAFTEVLQYALNNLKENSG